MRIYTGVCGCRQEGEWADIQWLQKLFSTAHKPNCHVHFSQLHETDCRHFAFSISRISALVPCGMRLVDWNQCLWYACHLMCASMFVLLCWVFLFVIYFCSCTAFTVCCIWLINLKFPVLKHSSSIVYIYIYIYTANAKISLPQSAAIVYLCILYWGEVCVLLIMLLM